MRVLYHGVLLWLDESGQARYEDDKTGGEYADEIRGRELRPSFRSLLRAFYPVAYGGKAPGRGGLVEDGRRRCRARGATMSADARQPVQQRRVILVTAILVVVVAFLVPQTGDEFAENAPPSSFLVATGGTRALYLTAQQVGLDVDQWMRASAELLGPGAPDHLVVLAPSTRYAEADAAAILAWAAAGRRTLVYVPTRRRRDPLLSKLGVDFKPGDSDRDSRPQAALRPAANLPDRLRPVLADVAMPVEGVQGRFDLAGHSADDAAALLVDAAGDVGAALQVGETSVLLLADHAG